MAKKTFNFKNTNADISSKNANVFFDAKRKLVVGSVDVRGDDYEPNDLYAPKVYLVYSGTTVATLKLTEQILSNIRYTRVKIYWDPTDTLTLDYHENKVVTMYVADETPTTDSSYAKIFDIDLTPDTTVIQPLADGVEGDAVEVIFQFEPDYLQKFKTKLRWSLNADMTSSTDVFTSHISLHGTPNTFVAWDTNAKYIKELGHAPMKDLDVDWDETDVYIAGIAKVKGTMDITSSDENDKIYWDVQYNSERF